MKRSLSLVLPFFFAITINSCDQDETEPPKPIGPIPSQAQMDWHRMETNVFVHYTINTFTNKEWGYGNEGPEVFDPKNQDVDQWVTTFKEAGFKGLILTCKHHDGFCLWPSKYTDHTIENSPYKNGDGDVVKEVAEACHRHGLKFGVYLSPWDRNHAEYGDSEYITYYRRQLQELFTNYGPIFEMWFDGANGGDGYYGGTDETRNVDRSTYYNWPVTLEMVENIQPRTLFFSDAGPDIRWCGNEEGSIAKTNWNTISPDTLYAGKAGITSLLNTGSPDGSDWIPPEVDTSIRPGWFYHPEEDSLVKSPEELFDIYLNSVGRGATLLLNVPPDRWGLIHENDVAALKGWRKMIDEEFDTNFALNREVEADSYRGSDETFAPARVTDEDPDTYWATDDQTLTGSLEINLGNSEEIKYVVVQEFIPLGQRVKMFNIEAMVGGNWQEIAAETTIGYKRIVKIEPVKTNQIRINIQEAKGCPVISNVEVY